MRLFVAVALGLPNLAIYRNRKGVEMALIVSCLSWVFLRIRYR